MTVKLKAILLVTSAILVLSAFYSFQQLSVYKNQLENHISREKIDLHHTLSSCQKHYSTTYDNWLENFIAKRGENIKAFANRDRDKLFALTDPLYESLKQLNPHLEIMHFHLPDGRSFLRMHKPGYFDDDLRQIRPEIQQVHKTGQKTAGYEIGVYGAYYRIIHPVFYQGEYIGVVELGIDTGALIEALREKTGMETAIFFSNSSWEKASRNAQAKKEFRDYTLVGASGLINDILPSDFSFDKSVAKLEAVDKHFCVFSLKEIKNCFQQPIGGVLAIHDGTNDMFQQRRFLVSSLVVTIIFGAACVVFLSFSFQGLIGHLENAKKDQEDLIDNLNKEIIFREKAEDALQKSEMRHRLLLESAGEGIYGVDLEGRTTFMNSAAEKMTGFSEDEIMGRNQHEFLHHSHANGSVFPVSECPVHLAMKHNKKHTVRNEVFWKKDGSSFPVEYVATPVLEGSNVIGSVVLFCDITERKLLEKQLLQAQKMEVVGRLTSGISHDFNNILTTIIGYSELLMRQLDPQSAMHDKAKMIYRAGKMGSSLTRQLLSFSRKHVSEKKPVNLKSIIDKLNKMLKRLIGENISLTVQHHAEECIILGDVSQCEQILMNFAVNAKDAMPEGGEFCISTDIVRIDKEKSTDFGRMNPGSYVLLSVRDSGEGMSEETRKYIFEPFFTTKELGKGTGLGLAIVFEVMKQHNGFISVSSSPGKGTTFDMYFPFCAEKAQAEIISSSYVMPKGSGTILVVDDAADTRRLIRDTLEPLGYKILEAANGSDAGKIFQKHGAINLLITDLVMPGMNGKDLSCALTQLNPAMKTLFISGYADPSFENEGIGTNHFLPKPLVPLQIAWKIRKIFLETTV